LQGKCCRFILMVIFEMYHLLGICMLLILCLSWNQMYICYL
jgi:hypothetical protein